MHALIGTVILLCVYHWRRWQHDRRRAHALRQRLTAAAPHLAHTPRISMLVAAWNETNAIDAHMRSFVALSYPHKELIVCAGGDHPHDNTLQQAQTYATNQTNSTETTIVVLEQRRGEGKQRALARAYQHASGDILVLTDADCVYNDQALAHLLAPIINNHQESVACTTGTIRPLDSQWDAVLPRLVWSSDMVAIANQPQWVDGLRGANSAITRAALEQSGGLDFVAPVGTDYILAKRVRASGIAIQLVATSVMPTHFATTIPTHIRRQSRWLRNVLLYGVRYRNVADVQNTLITMAIGTGMLLMPLVALFITILARNNRTGTFIAIMWLFAYTHAVAAKVRYLLFAAHAEQRPVALKHLLGIVPFTAIEWVAWALPFIEIVSTRKRLQW